MTNRQHPGVSLVNPVAHTCMKALLSILIPIAGLLCGCASSELGEADARRMEVLKESHPALYQLERDQRQRNPESLEDYQRRLDEYQRQRSK